MELVSPPCCQSWNSAHWGACIGRTEGGLRVTSARCNTTEQRAHPSEHDWQVFTWNGRHTTDEPQRMDGFTTRMGLGAY